MDNAAAALAAAVASVQQQQQPAASQPGTGHQQLPSGITAKPASSGRFYVISAAEEQPAASMGHFVRIESGPHDGYDAAVASVQAAAKGDPAAASNGEQQACADAAGKHKGGELAKLLRESGTSGLPVQLEQLLSQGGSSLDANALQRLLQGGDLRAAESTKPPPSPQPQKRTPSPSPADGSIATKGELVFLPLDTPVWHLPNTKGEDAARLVTRAENVEWMRTIWGKMTDTKSVMEAIRRQALAAEEKQRHDEQAQQTQQNAMLSQLAALLGGGRQEAPSPAPSGPMLSGSNSSNNLNALLSQFLASGGAQQQQQPQHQPPPPQQHHSNNMLQSLQWELEAAMARQQQQQQQQQQQHVSRPMPCQTTSSMGGGGGGKHRRNASTSEITSMFDGSSGAPNFFQGFQPPAPRHQRASSTGGHIPFSSPGSMPVRADLMPGAVAPGAGQFYVVSADARIQLTESGFYLAVISGPHDGFDAAMTSLSFWTHKRPSMRDDVDMVHIRSDTPIWHSADLVHGAPLMVVRAASLLEPPRRMREPSAPPTPPPPQNAPNHLAASLAALAQQLASGDVQAGPGGLSAAQLQQLLLLQGMAGQPTAKPEAPTASRPPRSGRSPEPRAVNPTGPVAAQEPNKAARAQPASSGGEGSLQGRKRDAPSPPSSALPNKKAHMLRWQAAHPDGEASQPGSSAQDGGNGGGEEDDSATDSGELEVACGSKGAAQHEISSPNTSKAAAPSVPAKRPPRPSPLKVPGSGTQEL
eukprot:jgi/Tetstr1/444460/TSEL_032343.t2